MFVNSKLVRSLGFLLLTAALVGCASDKKPAWVRFAEKQPNKWGHYSGYVEARWENDGRSMTLLSELRYTETHRCCTMSLTNRRTGRTKFVTECFTTQCAVAE